MESALRSRVRIYDLLLLLALPFFLLWFLGQCLLVPRRRVGLAQRFGVAPRNEGVAIWVHAVSVGEVRAILPMMNRLREELGSRVRLVLSTVTVTGQETARRECPEADDIFYFPLDLPLAVSRALARVRPAVFVTAETELWPNFLAGCARLGIPVVVVNGRISDRSFIRYQAWGWFFAPFIRSVRAFLMQSPNDAGKIRDLGALPEAVRVTGNTKYDRVPAIMELPAAVYRWAKGFSIVTAGSTHRGEEEAMLGLLDRPEAAAADLRLVLVPRHPERFDEVASLLEGRGIAFSRYSRVAAGEEPCGRVFLVDAMGCLDGFYALADLAFVGGSLAPVGGHNLLEPAMQGKPVLTGPRIDNFREIAEALTEGGGARIVADSQALGDAVVELLRDPDRRQAMGRAAREISEQAAGASRQNAAVILELLGTGR